jgi:membrane associated rhomboid family serine protease
MEDTMGEWNALLVGLLCGVVSVLVDLDHIVGHYLGWNGRFLHTPLLIVAGVVILSLGAYLGRLLLG